MSDRFHRRMGGHLRRHGIAYAALIVAFSFSPVPSMAADLVTTGEIANGAVTQPKLGADSVVSGKILNETIAGVDIKNGTVGFVDLAPSAKPARVISYDLGGVNFSVYGALTVALPGTWNAAAVYGSQWSVTMYNTFAERAVIVPGSDPGSTGYADHYTLSITADGVVTVDAVEYSGEAYSHVRLYRTLPTSTVAYPQP